LNDADFLLIAARELANGPPEITIEALGHVPHHAMVYAAAQSGDEAEELIARKGFVQREFPGDVSDIPANLHVVSLAVKSQDGGFTVRRSDQVEQQPDRGCFSRAIRTQESKYLASFDLEIEAVNAASLPVPLRQSPRNDCRHPRLTR
jgi:hypothetical protein